MTALSVTFEGWHPRNIERVRRALDVSIRNEAIRAAFRDRPADSDPEQVKDDLARQYHLSPDTVDKVIWPR